MRYVIQKTPCGIGLNINCNIGFKATLLSALMIARRPNRERTKSTNSSVAQKPLTSFNPPMARVGGKGGGCHPNELFFSIFLGNGMSFIGN